MKVKLPGMILSTLSADCSVKHGGQQHMPGVPDGMRATHNLSPLLSLVCCTVPGCHFPDQTFETFHQMLFTIFLNSSISTFYHFYLIFLKSLKEKNICQCLVITLCILCLRNCYCFVTCLLLKKTQSQLPFTPRAGIVRQGEDNR